MNRVDAIFSCLCIVILFQTLARAEDVAKELNDTLRVDVSQGIALYIANGEANVTLSLSSLFGRNDVEQRDTGRFKLKKGILKRLGMTMMMVPLIWQLATLPATLASLKINLLRSIFIGKIALAIMLYNALRNSQKSEVVLIHKPEYHDHYYHTYHELEDDDKDWWGRRMKRHL
ncbi:uncharacterized protein LOC105682026 [Bombus impatiens]|uniref:Uncharacterized protein LOC105682026 n=1 Tax=Bombus impatiens TaxID=132113 RepID=A0A6P3V5X9_BOMIM|nr:uncharacterized protein LOC105682026 [Bombus impatiens]